MNRSTHKSSVAKRKKRTDNPKALLRRLNRIIDEEIRSASSLGQIADVESVFQKVVKRSSMLMAELSSQLGLARLRSMIQRKMKLVPSERIESDEVQMVFENMEEFRGVPERIAYRNRPHPTPYVTYLDSVEEQREAALALLDGGLDADHKTRDTLAASNEYAHRFVIRYGDKPLRELIALWIADGSPLLKAG